MKESLRLMFPDSGGLLAHRPSDQPKPLSLSSSTPQSSVMEAYCQLTPPTPAASTNAALAVVGFGALTMLSQATWAWTCRTVRFLRVLLRHPLVLKLFNEHRQLSTLG